MFGLVNSLRTRTTQRERGFSLSLGEGILVFIVAGLVIALGYKLFSSLMASFRANKVANEIQLFIPRIQTAYSNKPDYDGLSDKLIAQARWVNDSMIDKTNNTIKTQWGQMKFVPDNSNAEVKVTMDKIPARECVIISEAFAGHAILAATVNSEDIKDPTTKDIKLDKVAEGCSKDANEITFNFGRA